MKMTNEERQALIERIEEICAEYSKPNHSKAFSVKDVEIAELARIALAALTAEPVKVPDVMDDSIPGKNDSYIDKCQGWNACRAEVLRLNAIDNTAQQYEALAGWRMVPVEPTDEMLAAGDKFMDGLSELGSAYSAMLEAAPKPEA